jgi:NAD(P)H-dependent flavin oxidoreductase YrpB (nitropropane dioxygenase family)
MRGETVESIRPDGNSIMKTPLSAAELPLIIQGGMGVGVSGWRLARAVSLAGQLGVVSGTMLDLVIARTPQLGDTGGHIRRALATFPFQAMAERMLARYFADGGKPADEPFKPTPMMALPQSTPSLELNVLASYVSIWLAKENHDGVVGFNLLEKSQLPTMPALYGAMLAGVDAVLMGAGIPPGSRSRSPASRELWRTLPFTIIANASATSACFAKPISRKTAKSASVAPPNRSKTSSQKAEMPPAPSARLVSAIRWEPPSASPKDARMEPRNRRSSPSATISRASVPCSLRPAAAIPPNR